MHRLGIEAGDHADFEPEHELKFMLDEGLLLRRASSDAGLRTPVKFEEKLRTMALWNSRTVYLFTIKFLLPLGERCPILCIVFMGCFPCDTRLEAFPPYLGRVSPLTRLLSLRLWIVGVFAVT